MPEALAGATGHVATWLLTYLLHSTVLLGLAWIVVRTGLVRRPLVRDVLWKTVLVGSLLTATAAVVRDARRQSTRPVRAVRVTVTRAPQGPMTWRAQGRVQRRAAGWPEALVWAWVAGGILAGGAMARRRRALAGALGPLEPAGPRAHDAAAALREDGTPQIPVRVSDAVGSPCVVGGAVVLPPRCEEELDPQVLRAAVAHEMAHLARHDEAWHRGASALSCLLWIQPLNLVALSGMDAAAEDLCDAWAASRTDPRALARAIERVAAWALPGASQPRTALARSRGRTLSDRVARILALEPGEALLSDVVAGPWRPALFAVLLVAAAFLPVVPVSRDVTAVFIRSVEDPVLLRGDSVVVVTVRRENAEA